MAAVVVFLAFLALFADVTSSSRVPGKISNAVVVATTESLQAGYINVNQERGHYLFYWITPSQNNPSTDPVVLWLQGGPGASGIIYGLLNENGPIRVQPDLTTVPNPYSWNKNATVIYIDQPIGTGFAYSDIKEDEYTDLHTTDMMKEVYTFLQILFSESYYPNYAQLPFWVFGESYGGHYAPALSTIILEQNQAILNGSAPPDSIYLNLKGIGIGDGWVDPSYQFPAYETYAVLNGLLRGGSVLADSLIFLSIECYHAINKTDWVLAAASCNFIAGAILEANPGMSFYDIKLICPNKRSHDCYNFTASVEYVNTPEMQQALNVGDHKSVQSAEVPFAILTAINGDEELSFVDDVVRALESGLSVLVYNGINDFAANYIGTYQWLQEMGWSGQIGWNEAPTLEWHNSTGLLAGTAKAYGNLTFVLVNDAGHMVPMNQPANALDLFQRFLNGISFNATLPTSL